MYIEVRIMMNDEEKIIFEKAKSALIKLGKYSDDKENSDETKINDTLLEHLLTSALIEMHSTFYKIDSYSIEDKESRRLFQENRTLLTRGDFEDIDDVRHILSHLLPTLQEKGLVDRNEIALSMMEEVYNTQREMAIIQWHKDKAKGIKRMEPMSSEQWPFLNGVWRQHASEYVIAKSVLDSYGIDVNEEDVKKVWEERNFELFKRNNPGSISTDER